MGHIHLSCHGRCQRCVLIHEKHRQTPDLRFLAVIIRICLKDNLLSPVPLSHNVSPGADGILAVIFIIRMFRNDSYHRHGIRPDRIRPVHMEFHSVFIHSYRLIQHGKIADRTFFGTEIIGKRHILRSQRLSVRKFHIIPDVHSPDQAVLADPVILCQIHPDLQIGGCNRKGALDQRLVHMLSRSPSIRRIKSCCRFRCSRHGNDHRGSIFPDWRFLPFLNVRALGILSCTFAAGGRCAAAA